LSIGEASGKWIFEKADWGKFQEESNKLFRKINDELSVDRQSN